MLVPVVGTGPSSVSGLPTVSAVPTSLHGRHRSVPPSKTFFPDRDPGSTDSENPKISEQETSYTTGEPFQRTTTQNEQHLTPLTVEVELPYGTRKTGSGVETRETPYLG